MGRLCRLVSALCLSLGVLAAAAVEAAGGIEQTRPYRIDGIQTASGVYGNARVVYEHAPDSLSAAERRYITRSTVLGYQSAGALARRAVKMATPVGLAVQAALIAQDVLIATDSNGEPVFMPPEFGDGMLSPTASNYYNSTHAACNAVGTCIADHPSIVAQYIADNFYCGGQCGCGPKVGLSYVGRASSNPLANYVYQYGPWFNRTSPASGCEFTGSAQYSTGFVVSPRPAGNPIAGTDITDQVEVPYLTDHQIGFWMANPEVGLSTQAVQQLIAEALSDGYWPLWAEAAAMAAGLTQAFNQADPNYDPDLDQAAQRTAPESQGSTSVSTEWPGFCDWASIVCSFIDWFQADVSPPDDPDLPFIEVTEWDEVEVGGGSYSCPGMTNLGSFAGQPLNFSWALACDFVIAAKPIILIASIITSLLILVGWRGAS